MKLKLLSILLSIIFLNVAFSQIPTNFINVETRNITDILNKELNFINLIYLDNDTLFPKILATNFNYYKMNKCSFQFQTYDIVNLPPYIVNITLYGYEYTQNGIYFYKQPQIKAIIYAIDPENETLKYHVLIDNNLLTFDTNIISFTLPEPGEYKIKFYACDSRQCTFTEKAISYSKEQITPTPSEGGGGITVKPKPTYNYTYYNYTYPNITINVTYKEKPTGVQSVIEIIQRNSWLLILIILLLILLLILILRYAKRE